MPNASVQVATGSYSGTGAAQTITLGFRPTFVMLFNNTDGDVASFYIDGLAADKNISIDTETALEASNGITVSATGFSLGTGATVNENAKTFLYFAVGGYDPQ